MQQPPGYQHIWAQKGFETAADAGHMLKGSMMDQISRGGMRGVYNASHVETKMGMVDAHVSRPPCFSCQDVAMKTAQVRNSPVSLAFHEGLIYPGEIPVPSGVMTFHPNGSATLIVGGRLPPVNYPFFHSSILPLASDLVANLNTAPM